MKYSILNDYSWKTQAVKYCFHTNFMRFRNTLFLILPTLDVLWKMTLLISVLRKRLILHDWCSRRAAVSVFKLYDVRSSFDNLILILLFSFYSWMLWVINEANLCIHKMNNYALLCNCCSFVYFPSVFCCLWKN